MTDEPEFVRATIRIVLVQRVSLAPPPDDAECTALCCTCHFLSWLPVDAREMVGNFEAVVMCLTCAPRYIPEDVLDSARLTIPPSTAPEPPS